MTWPRITFGIIVLNGEPFTRYCLRSLYPFAFQIIVVEGAAPAAAQIATQDGHSSDATLEVLRAFKEEEDPEDKLLIITAEDEGYANGFWPGEKHEQSQTYAKRATGDYLWQVDIDEFYREEDVNRILVMLRDQPDITAVSFKQISFWGGFDYTVDGWYLHRGTEYCHRVFKWGDGYRYATHRPPTVVDGEGRDARRMKWVTGQSLSRLGIYMYHYSLVFPKQVFEKSAYYAAAEWADHVTETDDWVANCYLKLDRPFRVHNVFQQPSWLDRFHGSHPCQVQELRLDISREPGGIQLRQTEDIEVLLASGSYRLKRGLLRILAPVDALLYAVRGAVNVRLSSLLAKRRL